jgi:hypothetical protein
MRVPVYSSKVAPQGLPGARVNVNAPIEAFGGGAANPEKALQGATTAVFDFAQRAYDEAQEVEAQAAEQQAVSLANDLQVKVSRLQGRNAGEASELVSKEWAQTRDLGRNLTGEYSRRFQERLAGRYEALNHQTELHVAGEFQKADDQETQSTIETEINSIKLNAFDERYISKGMQNLRETVTGHAGRRGYLTDKDGKESPVYKARVTEALSAAHGSVIEARLAAGQYYAAKSYFDKAKKAGEVTAQAQERIESALDNQAVVVEGNALWSKIIDSKDARFPNGEMNQEMILQKVETSGGLNPRRAEAVRNFVKGKMSEQFYFDNKANQQREHLFKSEVLRLKASNAPLEEIMPLAATFARGTSANTDMVDLAENQEFIRRLYSAEKPSSEQLNRAADIEDMIAFGQGDVNLGFLQSEKAQGKVTDTQFWDLRDKWRRSEGQEVKASVRGAKQQAIEVAKNRYRNQRDLNVFRQIFHEKSASLKTAEEIKDLATDLMSDDPSTQFSWPRPWGGYEKFKVIHERSEKENKALGEYYTSIGKDQTNQILNFYRTKEGVANAKTLDEFAKEMGGMDKLRAGSPANNAIQSIIEKNRKGDNIKLTPENVKRILKQFPTGITK